MLRHYITFAADRRRRRRPEQTFRACRRAIASSPQALRPSSFSTGFEQRNVDKLQHTLDALADESVHVVATTGGIVAPNELAAPPNAIVLNYAAHDPILRRAALVVTHGGHGTAMRALRHGVPMVIVPGLAGDQPFVAAAVQEWSAGRALPGDAGAEAMRAAANEVLSVPSFRDNARQRATTLAGVDGAANAADEVEHLLDAAPVARRSASGWTGRTQCQPAA